MLSSVLIESTTNMYLIRQGRLSCACTAQQTETFQISNLMTVNHMFIAAILSCKASQLFFFPKEELETQCIYQALFRPDLLY